MNKTDFGKSVYDVVALIPKGRVTSYGAIAEYLGAKGSARLVGYIMHDLAGKSDLPAHRVVNRKGQLTGHVHFSEPSMADRLRAEGIPVEEQQIQNLQQYFWNPFVELSLDN